ncbi:beta-xylosidase [Streptomyces sp. MS1.HAVA.3]|uniref:Beta-xylosidase n=1 Tax=Streptomyces caledonius TaxID=3134107 RepID=A0ABU8U975_9ACTN
MTFPTQCLAPQEAGIPPADGPTTARITVDDPAPQVGDTVTVTYQVLATPALNPLGGELPAGVLTPTGRIVLAGAQSGEVTVVGAKRNDPVPAGAPLPAVTMTGTFTVTAPGEITLAPGGYTLHTSHLLDLGTTCTAAGPSATPVSERLTATELPTANLRSVFLGAAYGRPGAKVKVTAAGFPGRGRDGGRAGGRRRDRRPGDRHRRRTGHGPGGAAGHGQGHHCGDRLRGRGLVGAPGSGPAAYTVIDAVDATTPPPPPIPPPTVTRKVTATVEPGALGMSQTGEDISLGAVPYGDGGAAPGRIGTVTVTDARGGPAGWSLIGKVTDFTGPGGIRIPGASLSWTPSCMAAAGSKSPCTPGSAGVVGPDGAVLASTPDAPLVGGTFTVDAAVTLQVPAYTPPGAYTAVLTLTLS